jgi:hypothetical protein
MSPALTTLDGVAEGTDIAIKMGDTFEHWKWEGGRLQNKNGTSLPPFFFTGLLAEGSITEGNFAPPEPDEWWQRNGRAYRYLVLEHDADTSVTKVAMFRHDSFYSWYEVHNMVEDSLYSREAPEWDHPLVRSMTRMAWNQNIRADAAERRHAELGNARNYVRYARDYIDQAQRALGDRR